MTMSPLSPRPLLAPCYDGSNYISATTSLGISSTTETTLSTATRQSSWAQQPVSLGSGRYARTTDEAANKKKPSTVLSSYLDRRSRHLRNLNAWAHANCATLMSSTSVGGPPPHLQLPPRREYHPDDIYFQSCADIGSLIAAERDR